MNKKALSPIVATILLVVVAVILLTITLSWGRSFTNKGLDGSNTILKETSKNYMIGSPKLNAQGVFTFKNISPGDKSITITGYKIISSSEDSNFNSILDIEDTTVPSGGTHIISIPAFPPEQKVTIQLITDQNEYISVGSIQNIPEELQDISESEPELEPLSVSIDFPTDSNTGSVSYAYGLYKDFNATVTGGTGIYTYSWKLTVYTIENGYHLISGPTEISSAAKFNMQLNTSCLFSYVTLTVSSNGVEDATDGITYFTGKNGGGSCFYYDQP